MCHCNWCRKTSGHNGNTFIVLMDSAVSQPTSTHHRLTGRSNVPLLQFKQLSGTDSTFDRTADSGNPMKSHACEKCSTIMWVRSETKPHIKLIRSGTIDDQEVLNNLKPQKELFCSVRPASFAEYPGIAHHEQM